MLVIHFVELNPTHLVSLLLSDMTASNQYAKNLSGVDTNLRVIATYGAIAIVEDGMMRQEYIMNSNPQSDALIIDGKYYRPSIVNKPLDI